MLGKKLLTARSNLADYTCKLNQRLMKDYKHQNTQLKFYNLITSVERKVKDSRRSVMYQSYYFLTRLGAELSGRWRQSLIVLGGEGQSLGTIPRPLALRATLA